MPKQIFGTPFQQTATHATSAVATQTGVAGTTSYITDICGSSDKAGSLLLIKDGTTIIWQLQLATTAAGINAFNHSFSTPLKITTGSDCSITVDGTSACKSNFAGFTLP
jgi:hypothetical protein